jgi:hypothetical protein
MILDASGGPCPYPFVTSSSEPPCPLSRYRTELQTCSAIEKMRPVDGQRLPSAHLQFSLLFSRRIGYLHLSRIFRHFKSSYHNTVRENRPSGRRFSIPLPGSVIRLIRPFQGFTGARLVQSSRKGRSLHKVITSLLRAPPRGIPGYSLLSGGRLLAGDRHCALICVPPARHRILCLSAFRYMLTRIPQGTGTRYPRAFPQCRHSDSFHCRKLPPLRAVFIPLMH